MTIRNNVATMLQRCFVLKIVVANRLAQNNGKASLYKKVCCMFKVLFLANYTSIIVVFYRSRCLHRIFSITIVIRGDWL